MCEMCSKLILKVNDVNLGMFVTWIWFSVAAQRNLGWPHFWTELDPLAEMLQL